MLFLLTFLKDRKLSKKKRVMILPTKKGLDINFE